VQNALDTLNQLTGRGGGPGGGRGGPVVRGSVLEMARSRLSLHELVRAPTGGAAAMAVAAAPAVAGRGGPGGGPGGGRGGPGGPGAQAQVFVNPDGVFEIQNVVPGSYNLTALQPSPTQLLSARMRVEVAMAMSENVNLTLSPGVDIAGNSQWTTQNLRNNFR